MASLASRTVALLAGFLGCSFTCHPGLLHADQDALIKNFIHQGGYTLAPQGHMAMTANSDIPFVPASTMKILTSLAALKILGPDHRFVTRLTIDQHNNLYIQGGGDPFLLTENVITIVQRLQKAGLRQINNLIMDESIYQLDAPADGSDNTTNPYDARNSGLAVNFNTIALRIGADRTIGADDPKVPLLPIMQVIGATLPVGHHRVNVNAFKQTGQLSNTLRYSGELFMSLLRQQQIEVQGVIKAGTTPPAAPPILTYRSQKSVREMIRQCLKYSNNFVANQLFLACGMAHFGGPATWDKARNALQLYIRENLGLADDELRMVEGSGLSRKNQITPKAMITILHKFAPYKELLPVKKGIPLKSGTLAGVYCYAGYIPQQQDAPFVIFLNQVQNNRDEILQLLTATKEAMPVMTAEH